MSTSFVSVCAAIILVVCIAGQCAAAPMGTVSAELFTDAKCTAPYLNYGLLTESNVALDGSACQSVSTPHQYANIISCHDIGSSQYYYEQYWPAATSCSGTALMTFTHVAPTGSCSALHWTFNGTTSSPADWNLPPLYAQLVCTPYTTTTITSPPSNSAAPLAGTIIAAIAAASTVLLSLLV